MIAEAAASRRRSIRWPSLILLPALAASVLYPATCLSVVIVAVLLFIGMRYPVGTVGIVLVAIPVVDQAIADRQFADVFGAFRLTPAVVLKGMMSLVIITYLVRKRLNPLRYRPLRPMVAWLAYMLFTCFLFHDRGLAISMWLRLAYWVSYFIFFYLVATEDEAGDYKVLQLWRAGILAIAIFSVSVHIAKVMGIGGEYYKVGESYGFYADPWNMSMTLPGGLVLVLLYPWVAGDRRFWVKWACAALALMTVLASFFTMTRTSLIACLFAMVLCTFGLRKVVRSRSARVMFVVAVLVVGIAALLIYRNMTSTERGNTVSARWSETERGDIGSGRMEVFYAAWSKFVSASGARQLVGHGIGAGPEAAEEFMGVYTYLHDDLLEMLVCAGVAGVALYFWFFGRFYRDVLRGMHARSVWAVVALTSLGVYSLTCISYMRVYSVTPNTYFALAAGTSLGMLGRASNRNSKSE